MALYDSLFGLMDLQSAQVLVTSNDFQEPTFKKNLCATVEDLLSMSVVPVFNENDAISDRGAVRHPPPFASYPMHTCLCNLLLATQSVCCIFFLDLRK